MCKIGLRKGREMSAVEEAEAWSKALVAREYRGPGDTIEAAMYRLSARSGISENTFWALRYRKPKDIMASIYLRLKAAYEHEIARQEAKLAHELELTRKVLGDAADSNSAVRAAEALVGKKVD